MMSAESPAGRGFDDSVAFINIMLMNFRASMWIAPPQSSIPLTQTLRNFPRAI